MSTKQRPVLYSPHMRKLIALILLSVAAWAADVSGTWSAAVVLDAGQGTATFVFKQSGNKLTGTYSGTLGKADVTGTVEGNKIEWSFENPDAGKVSYSGTLDGDKKIKGTVVYGQLGNGTFTADKQ
jgi:hypothetical protein